MERGMEMRLSSCPKALESALATCSKNVFVTVRVLLRTVCSMIPMSVRSYGEVQYSLDSPSPEASAGERLNARIGF
jgi:hypothetical protein